MKESSAIDLIRSLKVSGLERFMQMVHRMVQKSCRTACQLLCCPIDRMLDDRPSYTCCPAQCHQSIEDKNRRVRIIHPPSTILIVNISNSTLVDCIIGNNSYPSAVEESQRLMQEPELPTQEPVGCSCSHGQQGEPCSFCPPPPPAPSAESAGIHIHSSHLNCVIIGDNNYMHVEQTLADTEAQSEAWAS